MDLEVVCKHHTTFRIMLLNQLNSGPWGTIRVEKGTSKRGQIYFSYSIFDSGVVEGASSHAGSPRLE